LKSDHLAWIVTRHQITRVERHDININLRVLFTISCCKFTVNFITQSCNFKTLQTRSFHIPESGRHVTRRSQGLSQMTEGETLGTRLAGHVHDFNTASGISLNILSYMQMWSEVIFWLLKEFKLKRPVQVARITKQLRVREIQLSEKYQQNVYVSIAPAI
jgi:hypothetical protein